MRMHDRTERNDHSAAEREVALPSAQGERRFANLTPAERCRNLVQTLAVNDTDWTGTEQHPHARDLSRYLVHLTRSRADLEAILAGGALEARNPFGVARHIAPDRDAQKVVCFTETPIPDLSRMVTRGRRYGIVFSLDQLRLAHGASPVWYLTEGSNPDAALGRAMAASTNPRDDVWCLTPFIDRVKNSGSPHDFRWEREWRIRGDFEFSREAIATLLVPDNSGELEAITSRVGSYLFLTAAGDYFWTGSDDELYDEALQLLVDGFLERFMTPDNAGLPRDRESEDGYFPVVSILDTDEAVLEVFEDLPEGLRRAVSDEVNGESTLWCRTEDVANAHL